METVAEVARGDGSTAWAVALLNVCTWFATTFSQEARDDVFGANPDAKCCGIFTPGSKAVRVDGGYTVSGQWAYSSGSFAADWGTLGLALDVDEGEDPRAPALIPKEAWTIKPTWFVAGMKGSGSDTIVVQNHFVPDHRVQRFATMREADFATPHKATERNSNMAFLPVAALIPVGAQVGLARHAMELTLEKLPTIDSCKRVRGEDGLARSSLVMTQLLTAALLGCLPIDLSHQWRAGRHRREPG